MYPDGLLSPSEISEVVEFTLAKFCEGDDYATEFAEDPPTSLYCFAIDEYNPITDIPADARFLPSDRLWVLRNLTARVYVRADKLAIGEGLVEGLVICGIGFGEVVVMKTCWPGVYESGVPGVGQGEWAGNCFDITRIDMVRGDGWKDVSDEVVALIGAVWEASFGQDWKKVVLACEKE